MISHIVRTAGQGPCYSVGGQAHYGHTKYLRRHVASLSK